MLKGLAQQRYETANERYGGKGEMKINHVFEKSELLANCRLFARVVLDQGCSIGYHQHDQEEEIYYILSGQGIVNDNGETHTVNPGDAVYTGNGSFHSIENQGESPLEFLAVILTYQTPQR